MKLRQQQQQQPSLCPNIFWSKLQILKKLIKFDHMFSFPQLYSIQSHSPHYFLNWHIHFYYFY